MLRTPWTHPFKATVRPEDGLLNPQFQRINSIVLPATPKALISTEPLATLRQALQEVGTTVGYTPSQITKLQSLHPTVKQLDALQGTLRATLAFPNEDNRTVSADFLEELDDRLNDIYQNPIRKRAWQIGLGALALGGSGYALWQRYQASQRSHRPNHR